MPTIKGGITMADKKHILLLTTGGTIASVPGGEGLEPHRSDVMERELAQLRTYYDITVRDVMCLDSSNIRPQEWQFIAREIFENRLGYDGIVVSHGTDTMAYTASAVTFMLPSIDRPVVFTGSQLPLRDVLSDGPDNLRTAFAMAATGHPGVFLAFDRKVMLGCRAVKVRASGFSAFESVNARYAARVTGLLALPCGVGMTLLAGPIASLRYSGVRLLVATQLLQILGVCIFFYAGVLLFNAILQSHNYAHIPVINTVVCGMIRLGLVYYLTANPDINVIGIPLGGMFSFVSILLLDLFAISRLVPQKPKLIRNLLRPALPAAIMGVAVWGCLYVLQNILHIHSALICCGVPVMAGVAVYAVAVIVCKTIKKEDCMLLPKGEKIAKLLKL